MGSWISLDPDVILVQQGGGAYEGWTYVSHEVLGNPPAISGLLYQGPLPPPWGPLPAPASE